jgi:hypothetical protein
MLKNIRTRLFDEFDANPATQFSDEYLEKMQKEEMETSHTPRHSMVSHVNDDFIVEGAIKDQLQQYNDDEKNDVDNIDNFIYSDDVEDEDESTNNMLNRITSSPYYTTNRMNTMRALTQTDSD